MNTWIIVAGGSSLKDFDWKKLEGLNVIAINRSLEVLPFAPVVYFSDCNFWNRYRKSILAHSGQKFSVCPFVHGNSGVTYLVPSGFAGLETDPRFLREGKHSGYAAINLAVARFKAKRIFLLGYDMQGPHWHDGYGSDETNKLKGYAEMIDRYLAIPLQQHGVEAIIVGNSLIKSFPRISFEEFDEEIRGLDRVDTQTQLDSRSRDRSSGWTDPVPSFSELSEPKHGSDRPLDESSEHGAGE